MSKSDIQSWLSSAKKFEDDGSDSSETRWKRDRVMEEWQNSMIAAQNILMEGKTNSRTSFLHDELLPLAKHGGICFIAASPAFRY